MATYLLEYSCFTAGNTALEYYAKVRAKNKSSELQAKIDLEKFLKRKFPNMDKLIVHKCTEDIDFLKMPDFMRGIFK